MHGKTCSLRRMTYLLHLNKVVDAFLAASGWSAPRLSVEAGLGVNWVSQTRNKGNSTLRSADAIVETVRRHCPPGDAGAEVRALLAMLDQVAPKVSA